MRLSPLLVAATLGLASFLVFIPQRVNAATPASYFDSKTTVQITTATGNPSTISCASVAHCISNVTFGANLYFDKSIATTSLVNFTNSAYSTSTSTGVGTFGAAANGGQCKVTAETANSVTFTLLAVGSSTMYCYFYYPSGTTDYQVITQGVTITSFVAQSATITTCGAPCAYDSGKYVEVKVGYSSPTTIEYDIKSTGGTPSTPSGGGGGGTIPVGSTAPTCPSGQLYNATLGACQSTNPVSYSAPVTGNFSQVLIGLGVVGGILLLVVGSIVTGGSKTGRKEKHRQPKGGKGGKLW